MEMIEQIVETRPRVAAALTPAIEPLPQSPHALVEELFQSVAVARHPVVVVVPTKFKVQRREQFLHRSMAALLAPLCEVRQRVAELLARRPPLQMWLARAILSPVKLKPEEIEPCCTRLSVPAEGNHPALGGGQLQSELAQALLQRPVEMLRLILILERADKIIRVANQAGLARCVPLHDLMKPQIQHVMQIHVGKNRWD